MSATQKVAEFIVRTDFPSFPEEAVYLSKRLFLDCLGVALAAVEEPVVQKLTRILKTQGGKKEAWVWGKNFSLPLLSAVLINGTMAHALDFDDSAFSHPTATLLPVVVALGEKLDLSGQEVLGALMVGYEVFAGISLSSNQKLLRGRGWHPTPVLGTMAAAGAAAKLMRLQEKEVIMSLGIAGSLASGLGQNFGTMVKPLHAGVSARNGLFAAQLAAGGVRANDNILEAPRGFGTAFFGPEGYSFEKIGQILGPPFKVVSPGINIKPYPCCRGAHQSIDAALVLHQKMKEMQIGLEQIESIACDFHLDGPTLHSIPRNGLEGKFSIAYCVAAALKEGRVALEDFVDEKISDPVIQDLMKKTKNIRLSEKDYYVTIQLRDGRSFSHSVKVAKGDARENPLADEEVAEKFKACATRALSSRKIVHAVKQISQMEKISHIRKFFAQIMTAS